MTFLSLFFCSLLQQKVFVLYDSQRGTAKQHKKLLKILALNAGQQTGRETERECEKEQDEV